MDAQTQFPYLEKNTFLNFAATCPMPLRSLDAMKEEVDAMQKPLGPRFYKSLAKIESARKKLAAFVGAHPSEIAFTQNTSSALSTLALSLDLKKGDRVLVPEDEFPSNLYPWKNLSAKGVETTTFKIAKDESVLAALRKQDLTNVRLVSASAVSYKTGKALDCKAFAKFCADNNIYSCVDAIQAIGAVHFDCREFGIDFMCSGAQKWLLGPVGCGFLYARKDLLETLHVPLVGWASHQFPEYFDPELKLSGEMTRFEPGLPNYLPILGMGASLDFLNEVGAERIQAKIQEHAETLRSMGTALGLEPLLGDQEPRTGIYSAKLNLDIDHRRVQEAFQKADVAITVKPDYIRISPHFLNREEDLAKCMEVVAGLKKRRLKTSRAKPTASRSPRSNTVAAPVLINGASGNLGSRVARRLVQLNIPVYLLGRSPEKLKELAEELSAKAPSLIAGSHACDFQNANWANEFERSLPQGQKFAGLINCSGGLAVDLVENQSDLDAQNLFQSQYFAPMTLTRLFIQKWRTPKSLGALNVVSSSGRCGYPLLSNYGAAHGALWTFTESLRREYKNDFPVMLYIAPSQHSPLQKTMGRLSIRYYKVGDKGFDYAIPEEAAKSLVSQFLTGRRRQSGNRLKLKIWLNRFAPSFFDKKVDQAWSKD